MDVPQRVLFVTGSLFPLGPPRQMLIVAWQLASAGTEVAIATLSDATHLSSALSVAGIPVHSIRQFNRRDWQLPFRLRNLIQSFQPELIHSWDRDSALISSLAMTGVKQPPRFMASLLTMPGNKSFTRQLFERHVMKLPETVMVPHDSLKQHLVQNPTWPELDSNNIQIVPNAAMATQLDRSTARTEINQHMNISENAGIAVVVSPLVPASRIKDLIWTVRLVTSFHKDFHLLVVGSGPQLPRLRRFAQQVEISSRVHFLGSTQLGYDAFAGADMLWHAHRQEPDPTAVLTAMASGIPVVCTHGRETGDLVISQQTGMSTNFGARDEFARWTKYFVEKPESAKLLASQALNHVEQNFSIAQSISAYRHACIETISV